VIESPEQLLGGAEESQVVLQLGDDGSRAEFVGGERDEAGDLRTRYTQALEPEDDGVQRSLHAGAEELGVPGDDGSNVGAGEAEAGEECEHSIGIGWGLDVGELRGGLEGLRSREAAGVDEVFLDGEARAWRNGGRGHGEEPVERTDGEGGGGRAEMGEDGFSEAKHACVTAAVAVAATEISPADSLFDVVRSGAL
jgi:hypothetical protein